MLGELSDGLMMGCETSAEDPGGPAGLLVCSAVSSPVEPGSDDFLDFMHAVRTETDAFVFVLSLKTGSMLS